MTDEAASDDHVEKEVRRTITLSLTEQEAQTLFEIADAACRGAGLKMAGQCAFLAQKLTVAVQASSREHKEPPNAPI